MTDPVILYRFLRDRRERGERVALVTLVGITGTAAREPGAQAAVSETGEAVGSFSAGCAEAAMVAEAQEAMRTGRARTVRFGAGSPFMDIRLPCGGGIELLFTPQPPSAMLRRTCALLEQRRPMLLRLSADGVSAAPDDGSERVGRHGNAFLCRLEPSLRLVVAGQGAEPGALLRLAGGLRTETMLLSADATCIAEAEALGVPAVALRGAALPDGIGCDPHTAVVLLFHDHEREDRILCWALAHDAFFIGAMGSRRTHAERCRRLAVLGVAENDIARIVGPVGLIGAARDPETLAVSVLAQVVQERARMARRPEAPPAGTGPRRRSPPRELVRRPDPAATPCPAA